MEWIYNASYGSLATDVDVRGASRLVTAENIKAYGGEWFVGESMTREMAARVAAKLGGSLTKEIRSDERDISLDEPPEVPDDSDWIHVDERLPSDEFVLVCCESADEDLPFRAFAFYSQTNQRFELIHEMWADAITHWMPFPDLPDFGSGQDDEEE